jgi:hypothetical protein
MIHLFAPLNHILERLVSGLFGFESFHVQLPGTSASKSHFFLEPSECYHLKVRKGKVKVILLASTTD